MGVVAPMSFRDSMFLLAEAREHPTHVGSLMLFDRPEGAGPDFLGELYRRLLGEREVAPLFRRKAVRPLSSLGQWTWTEDTDLDLEYHVRLSALPRPGRVRELLELVSRLHGSLLDRHRPLWEFHLIEGVEGERFAVYAKIHHAMMDGVTSMKHLQKSLSTDPAETSMRPFWAVDPRSGRKRTAEAGTSELSGTAATAQPSWTDGVVDSLRGAWRTTAGSASLAVRTLGVGPALLSTVAAGLREDGPTLPFAAPPSLLNVPITGARRFAAESWPLKRLERVSRRTGSTLNDVVLAMTSGSLRRYLTELGELPERSLVAALPVSLGGSADTQQKSQHADRGAGPSGDDSGNQLGAILVDLATDTDEPGARLAHIRGSSRAAKDNLRGRDGVQTAALSLAVAAPIVLGLVPGASALPQGFNLIVSNVPGPTEPLYWEGAKLDGLYPMSVPLDGQAMNVTVTSYADHMEFGLTGCRSSVPRLQRMLGFLEESLVELEEVADAGTVGEDDGSR